MAADPYRYFRLEARELLEQLGAGMLALEKGDGGQDRVQKLLRHAHTLKGAARVVKLQDIADQAHAIEDALAPYRDDPDGVSPEALDATAKSLRAIGQGLAGLQSPPSREEENGPGQSPSPSAASERAEEMKTIRVDIADMDALLEGMAEIHALLNALRSVSASLEPARHTADLLLAQLSQKALSGSGAPRAYGPPHGVSALGTPGAGAPERIRGLAEELWKSLNRFEGGLETALDQTDRELRQLRDAAEQMRLMPVQSLLDTLERTARDIAAELGKKVAFSFSGGGLRLDAHVLGAVQGALVQIIRNALAHGIEPQAERAAMGKTGTGTLSIHVRRQGRAIVFTCADDGRGVDLEAIRRIAQQRGLVGAGPGSLNGEDLIRMLLKGGISTAGTVTEIAGRGIGLDVVRSAMEHLGGTIAVDTRPGHGTTFRLTVPPALASLETLTAEAAGTVVSLPLDAVAGTLRLKASELIHSPSGTTIMFQDDGLPFTPLHRLLGEGTGEEDRDWTCVVIQNAEAGEASARAAIGVDRLLGTQRVVMRPLPPFAPASPVVAGASLDNEGNPQLVLDAEGLIGESRTMGLSPPVPGTPPPPILVIDDSLTTRMLEQSILEAAGYEVDVAVSAEDGLDCARRKRYGLFLVDVEMPGMDGFTFIECIRADPALHAIPALLVTSRASPEDRRRGIDAGAQGYVVKSEFDQVALLKMIKPLME